MRKTTINYSFSRFCFLFLVQAAGYAYVAWFLCNRQNPFSSPNGNSFEFVKLIALCPLMFLFGVGLRLEPNSQSPHLHALCRFFAYLIPFFVALHYEYLGRLLKVNFSLTVSDLSNLDFRSMIVFGVAIVVFLLLGGYHLYISKQTGIFLQYFAAFLGVVSIITLFTILFYSGHYLHLHHYFFALIFMFFTRFSTIISQGTQGLLLGIYVEGVSRWGMDTLWNPIT